MKKILLGVCFKSESRTAVEDAYMLASRYKAAIIPIHVVEEIPPSNHQHEIDLLTRQINKYLKEVADSLSLTGLDIYQPVIEAGKTPVILETTAKTLNCDLVIIGAGVNNWQGNTLGVMAKSMLHSCSVPLWVSNCRIEKFDYDNILCAVDLSKTSLQTLNSAASVARILNAKLHIIHVEPQLTYYPGLLDSSIPVSPWALGEYMNQMKSEEEYSEQHEEYVMTHDFQDFLEKAELGDIVVKQYIKSGKASSHIIDFLKESETGLLVMGSRPKSRFLSRFFGGTAEQVVDHLPSSLLVIPHSKDI